MLLFFGTLKIIIFIDNTRGVWNETEGIGTIANGCRKNQQFLMYFQYFQLSMHVSFIFENIKSTVSHVFNS